VSYLPDITRYQQLKYGGATRGVDCTAWGGALCADAHTQGAIKLSGRAIRLASDEPVPDPRSPGLNVAQVDAAIYRLTAGRVNLDTVKPGSVGRTGLRERVVAGQWVNLAVKRSVLLDRGYLRSHPFGGAHDITVHCNPDDPTPVLGDPLVPFYQRASWDAILDAAQAVSGSGHLFASFTRDVIPEYAVRIHPRPGFDSQRFLRYFLTNGTIRERKGYYTEGFSATCTAPRWHGGKYPGMLVQLTSGSRKGWYVAAGWAQEV